MAFRTRNRLPDTFSRSMRYRINENHKLKIENAQLRQDMTVMNLRVEALQSLIQKLESQNDDLGEENDALAKRTEYLDTRLYRTQKVLASFDSPFVDQTEEMKDAIACTDPHEFGDFSSSV